MNWYKFSQSDIKDTLNSNGKIRLAYPISKVKKVSGKHEWIIDLKSYKGMIPDINEVGVGDEIWDENLHAILNKESKPYWKVEWIDEGAEKITVSPINDNPLSTGIGAGGHELTDFDYHVQAGEFEKDAIDHVLRKIQSKEYVRPSQIAYILLGAVPMQMGANGAQGGWYSVEDIRNNRGGIRGMSVKEIILKDAAALKKMGFTLPQGAIDGNINPKSWSDFVGGSNYQFGNFKFEYHPINEVEFEQAMLKEKNPAILIEYFNELVRINTDSAVKVAKNIINKFGQTKSPKQDPYYMLKENMISWAGSEGFYELIFPFLKSDDIDVRKQAIRILLKYNVEDPVEIMNQHPHPQLIEMALSAIKEKYGVEKMIKELSSKESVISRYLNSEDYMEKSNAENLMRKIQIIKNTPIEMVKFFM